MTRRLVVASLRRLLAPRRADALDAATRTLGVHVVGHVAVSNEPPSCVCGQVGLIGKPFLRSFIADYNEFMQQSSPAAAAAATRTGDEIDAMIGLGEKIRTAAAAINADRAKCRCGGEQRPRPFLVDDGMRRIRSRLDRLHGLKTAIGSGGGSAAAAGSKYEIKERGPRLAAPPAGGSSSVDTDRGQRATVGDVTQEAVYYAETSTPPVDPVIVNVFLDEEPNTAEKSNIEDMVGDGIAAS